MNHTAAENFYPSRVLTNATTFSTADLAVDIHFGTGFSKWKVTWPEPDLHFGTIHFLYKIVQGLLKIGE